MHAPTGSKEGILYSDCVEYQTLHISPVAIVVSKMQNVLLVCLELHAPYTDVIYLRVGNGDQESHRV